MSDVRERARRILAALPLSERQRELYGRGMESQDEAELERTTNRLEASLARAPETLAAAKELLKGRS